MTLAEAQTTVDSWIQANGGYFDVSVNLARLLEETGELSHNLLRTHGILKPAQGSSMADNEFGDALFVLCALANQSGISLTESLKETMDRFNRRDPGRHT